MTHAHPRTSAAAAFGIAGCLLLAACSSATPAPAAHTNTPAVQTTAGATDATSVASTDPASTGASPAAAPAAGADACTLVSEQEVGTALGTDPGLGSPFTSHGSSQCQYGSYQTAFVLVNVTPTQGKAAYDLMHNNPKVGNAGAVAGVGDRAFEISGPKTASIYFNKGDALVLVMVEIHTATSPPKDQALALADAAANRI